MDTLELKNRIKDYIDKADERMLRIIHETIENDQREIPQSHKEVLQERLKYHEEHPEEGLTWREVRETMKRRYGL